jgi:hypothetical protein
MRDALVPSIVRSSTLANKDIRCCSESGVMMRAALTYERVMLKSGDELAGHDICEVMSDTTNRLSIFSEAR